MDRTCYSIQSAGLAKTKVLNTKELTETEFVELAEFREEGEISEFRKLAEMKFRKLAE